MARSVDEIKTSITTNFMNNETVRAFYGLETGDEFDRVFSAVSVENALFDVYAISVNDFEQLVDEVEQQWLAILELQKAHRPQWYREKALDFQVDTLLVPETDYYDNTGLSEAEINDLRIVKYAAVTESADSSLLTIKVATESGGIKGPITPEQQIQVEEYFEQIKDPINIDIININPYKLEVNVDVFYDALLLSGDVQAAVQNAISNYVNNLPFNAQYSNMALVDAIQQVAGVKVVQHKFTKVYNNSDEFITDVENIYIPLPGYFELFDPITINMIPYNANEGL